MNGVEVVVVGGGNAGLCAAIAACERGASVTLLEKAPRKCRGGNSRFADGAIRFAYDGIDDVRALLPGLSDEEVATIDVGSYPADTYLADFQRLTGGKTDAMLAERLVRSSAETVRWMARQGVAFAPIYDNQAFREKGRARFWGGLVLRTEGRGIGLVDSLFRRAEALGVDVRYGSAATGLELENERIGGVRVSSADGGWSARCGAVVLACGGFEANARWRERYLGPGWRASLVRGTPFNTGDGLEMALDAGAQRWGDWAGCHAVAMDVGAPPTGDFDKSGDVYKKHSYPLGIVVNREGVRFVDEGADFRNYTYARYGRELLAQPGGVAYQIFDAQVADLLRSEYSGPDTTRLESSSLRSLADQMDIDATAFLATVARFNEHVQDGEFRPHVLDGKATAGLSPPKSNWALRIEEPPFLAFPVRCGITFTFGGVRVDEEARVLRDSGAPIRGLFAAGEMVGGLFHDNYPGGSGLMSGAVFGRIAGTAAAEEARGARPRSRSALRAPGDST